jgi:hypothetical protein
VIPAVGKCGKSFGNADMDGEVLKSLEFLKCSDELVCARLVWML